jgi:glycosyltransferase involved in cell wall biosynthesis
MRILLISHTCQSRTEGQPKARCLANLPGIDLRVLVPNRWKHYGAWRSADPVPPDEFSCTIGKVAWPWIGPAQYYMHWYPGLRGLLREFRPDVIDLWEEPWGLVSAQACYLRDKLMPSCKIVTETEQNINKHLPFPFERFRAYTLSRADFAIGRNIESLSVLRSKGYRGEAEVVPNAVDDQLFLPLDRKNCRKRLNVSGFVAGYVGRLVEEKGLMDMVDALPFCPPEINLLFVGAGEYSTALTERSAQLKVSHRVRIEGARALHELPEIMNAIDVLVLPSRTTPSWKEQFGRVIIEAHSCGTAVAGSSSGAIPEVVGDGGIVFPERNPELLGKALCGLNANRLATQAMGERGRIAVKERFTWQRVAQRMDAIYSRVSDK